MNASTSEYSSGCESGWTMYLDQISNSDAYSRDLYQQKGGYDDEDQSMLSDASSGPPAYEPRQDSNAKAKSKSKSKSNTYRKEANQKKQPLCLDDTASSSIFHFDQGNVPRSHDSAAHFEGESVTKKRLSFFKSSTKGKSGSVVGRKRQ